ncbi:MAG: hypothetical protein JO304_17260 [Solirubrobacterales bacterium]|nr:hypothetical protein [Solirubrobacterales bacterium]
MSTSTANVTEVRPSGVTHSSMDASMHAVVLNVTVTDADAAAAAVRDQVVPQVSGTPGFVAGYWVRLDGNRGTAVVVFESEDTARSAAAEAQPPGELMIFDSVEVGEVIANT